MPRSGEVTLQAIKPTSRVKVIQAKWIQDSASEGWLKSMVIGHTLNVCCGMSEVGQIRLDISPKSRRTAYGNLDVINFPPASFDTVICDPPFSYYSRFKWITGLADLTRRRLMLSIPTIGLYLGSSWVESLYALKSGGRFLRLWDVWDRLDERLTRN